MKNNLSPVETVSQITEFPELKYLPGFPRPYRFDAKKGVLSYKGEQDITPKGGQFAVIPLAFRIFSDDILGYGRRKWAELFFVNQSGQICAVMFHGFSVDNLQRLLGDLFYENAGLCEIRLIVRPEPRSNQHGSFYIAEFGYELLNPEEIADLEAVAGALSPIYREETCTGDAIVHLSRNFSAPVFCCPEPAPAETVETAA